MRGIQFPAFFRDLEGLNDPEKHKHKAKSLSCPQLIDLEGQLKNFLDSVNIAIPREHNIPLLVLMYTWYTGAKDILDKKLLAMNRSVSA